MLKRARIIYNPTSGREEMKKNLAYVLESLEKQGYEASAHATTGAGDAIQAAKYACTNGHDLIVAAGGDGTVNEVISGMAKMEHKPTLAILPMGTSNDFAKAIGMPKKVKKAMEIIGENRTQSVDIGQANDSYFINIAGGGTLTELTYEVPSKLKTAMGQMAYYIKGFEKVANFKPFDITIETKGMTIEDKVMLFLVANSNIVGGFNKLAPTAKVNDGFFDVFILRKCNIAELARVMSLVPRGLHINDPKVFHFKAESLKVTTKENIQLNLDGEFGGVSPCEFKVLKNHIKVITGKKK